MIMGAGGGEGVGVGAAGCVRAVEWSVVGSWPSRRL